jgi:hypothetical protein
MGKQMSPLKISGLINDLSFYQSQDGFLVRKKGGVSADKIKTDPRFRITRLNGVEFGTAGKQQKFFALHF